MEVEGGGGLGRHAFSFIYGFATHAILMCLLMADCYPEEDLNYCSVLTAVWLYKKCFVENLCVCFSLSEYKTVTGNIQKQTMNMFLVMI